jgi:CBS-domain-containing membrane protein
MSLTNYTDLQTTIASYLARSDLTAMIPDFIRLAETRLRRELRIRQMLKVVTTTAVAGDSTVELPSTLYDRGLTALTVSDDQGEYAGSPISISIATR